MTIRDCQHTNASPTFTKLQFLPPRKGSPPWKGQRVVAPSDGPHVANSFSVTVTAARRRSWPRYTGCCVAMKGDDGSSRRHAGPQDGFHTWLRMLVQKSQGLASFFVRSFFRRSRSSDTGLLVARTSKPADSHHPGSSINLWTKFVVVWSVLLFSRPCRALYCPAVPLCSISAVTPPLPTNYTEPRFPPRLRRRS